MIDRTDPFTTPEWRAYADRAVRELVPKLKASDVVVSIAPDEPDAKAAIELGFTLLLGKPLILLVDPGRPLPPGLARAADRIVVGEIQHPKTAAKIRDAMTEVMETLDLEKEQG